MFLSLCKMSSSVPRILKDALEDFLTSLANMPRTLVLSMKIAIRIQVKVININITWVYGEGRQGRRPTSLFVGLTPLSDLSPCKK